MNSDSGDKPQAKAKKEGSGTSAFLSDLRGTVTQTDTPSPSKSSRIPSTHLLTVALMAFGGASLYGMRLYSRYTGLSVKGGEAIITPVSVDSVTDAQTRRIIADLESQGVPEQLPLDGSHRNPFAIAAVGALSVDDSDRRLTEEQRRLAEEQARLVAAREQEIAAAIESIEVTSVMLGARPIARINGKIYRVGDKVVKLFAVLEIGERGVKLGCDGREYERLMKSELNSDGTRPDEPESAPGVPNFHPKKK